MSLTREKIDHICERTRQTLSRQEHELKPFFLIYESGRMKEALEEVRPRLQRTKSGQALHGFLQTLEEQTGPAFPGIIFYSPPPLYFWNAPQVTVPILLNIDELSEPPLIQQRIYHVYWHALTLLALYRKAQKAARTADYEFTYPLLKPLYDETQQTKNNLSADIFGVFMAEFEQKSGIIRKLALRQADNALEKTPGFLIEEYPFPLSMEVCQMVFDDLSAAFQTPEQMFPAACKMAGEITSLYGNELISQWRDFALPAQEMVWLDIPAETIMGYAVFTAEDPHIRTSAYMLTEIMGHEPTPSLDKNYYNAYIQGLKNREIHMAACEDAFQRVLSRAATMNDPSAFMEEIKRQNKHLMEGNPIGWCAHAIAEAGKTFEQCLQNDQITIEDVSDTLHKHLQQVSLGDILLVSRAIIALHRSQKPFNFNDIADTFWQREGTEIIIRTLRTSVKSDFFEANVTQVQRHKTLQIPVQLGFGPGIVHPDTDTSEGDGHDNAHEKTA